MLNFLKLLGSVLWLVGVFNLSAQAAVSTTPPAKAAPEPLSSASIKSSFGPNIEVVGGSKPVELKGDLNGDGAQDIAVLVKPQGKRGELAPGVKMVHTAEGVRELAPTSILNGKNSLAVIHGGTGDKFLIYAFGWIGWNGAETGPLLVLPKAKQKRDKQGYATLSPENYVSLPEKNKGDVIVVPTEAGINTILYWDGMKYRFWLDPGETS